MACESGIEFSTIPFKMWLNFDFLIRLLKDINRAYEFLYEFGVVVSWDFNSIYNVDIIFFTMTLKKNIIIIYYIF